MTFFEELYAKFKDISQAQLTLQELTSLRNSLKQVSPQEIDSLDKAQQFLSLLRKFREGVAEADKLHGDNYPKLLNSLLSVGEDGLYSNSLRFIFELIQNVDDCEFPNPDERNLTIHFDFNHDQIVLRYNESGFTPFNVFAITGIAEAAKNVASGKTEIGEKGIGFKSVFGVTNTVRIRSGWFSFELHKDNFTIPVASYQDKNFHTGTEMTLFVPRDKARRIYSEIKRQYCTREALFSRNPLLFLNKLTSLRMFYDGYRTMEFQVNRTELSSDIPFLKEDDVLLSVNLHDYDNGASQDVEESILCTRYTYHVTFNNEACCARYGQNTKVGLNGGKRMRLQAVFPQPEFLKTVGNGALYSFLPTQLRFTVPVVCHVPFKLDASREFVDPQDNNLWFQACCMYLSQLLDYAYQDWAKTVKNKAAAYLPSAGGSLFRENNGKEKCLSCQNAFSGHHFTALPVFFTSAGHYQPVREIFCFDPEEKVVDPTDAYKLLAPSRELFLPPHGVQLPHLGIYTEKQVYHRLFRQAISSPAKTAAILKYLTCSKFHPTDVDLPSDSFELTDEQLCLFMACAPIAKLLMEHSRECVSAGRRPRFIISNVDLITLEDVLYEDFKASEAPKRVESYLHWSGGKCVLLPIGAEQYLPCHNALVLSYEDPLASFAAFCYAVDNHDTFSVRMKHREISKRLDQLSQSSEGTPQDYLRELHNNRLLGKDAIGQRQYQNYIDLILQAGTSPGRFVQELLQNADDCDYADGVIPTFSLIQSKDKILTKYNEVGFTRSNIRSITAIGESTKNLLLKQDVSKIGEKGVGFKTIFAIASTVSIHSGPYHFSLSDKNPTIPGLFTEPQTDEPGTRMELTVKKNASLPVFNSEREILELCLCLRNLRRIQINKVQVAIDDTDNIRTITINRKQHRFRRFTFPFTVDAEALEERENGLRSISAQQYIVCYLPEKSNAKDYPLYSGLPTRHRIRVPLVIDAPFMLTTSREEIEIGSHCWNRQVRQAMYDAILSVIQQLREAERYKVLRLLRFVPRFQGTQRVYVNDMFDCEFLNSYQLLPLIRDAEILPTYDPSVFVSVTSRSAVRYPDAVNYLFSAGCFADISPADALDIPADESLRATLNALDCPEAPFPQYFPVLRKYLSSYMTDKEFRDSLYTCLQEQAPESYQDYLRALPLIPVYTRAGGKTVYIAWEDDAIFVKRNSQKSEASYYILNEHLLEKSVCEKILGVNINEMNAEWERSRYNDNLRNVIRGTDVNAIYTYLLDEFAKGSFSKYQSWEILMGMRDTLPLKNQLGNLEDTGLFVCEEITGFFQSDLVRSLAIHDECKDFATRLKYPSLSQIHYQDIFYTDELTEEDVEDLTADYFINSEEILRSFYRNGKLSDELVEQYGLEYINLQSVQEDISFDFPESPVRNESSLKKHVQALLRNPPKIVSVKVERTVSKLHYSSGNEVDIDRRDIRNQTLALYTPEDGRGLCFCQRCLKLKPYNFMEVNNIIASPKHYFPQTRIALCLECSKYFEAIRYANNPQNNHGEEDPFLKEIKHAHIGSAGYVDIPLGKKDHIRFTATHLAEIQEILRSMPK